MNSHRSTTRRFSARRFTLAIALVVLASLAASCGDDGEATVADGPTTSLATGSTEPETATTRVFEAENGSITIPTKPKRVVACGYAVLPLLQAKANLVGICEWNRELNDMTPEQRTAYDSLPKIGPDGDATKINYEAIAAARPDLIIMGIPLAFLTDVKVDALIAVAPVVAVGPRLPGDWRTVNPKYADAAGVKPAYDAFIEKYNTTVAGIKKKYAALSTRIFGGVCTNCPGDASAFRRAYASGFPTNLLDDLGFQFPGEPADPKAARHGETISIEQVGASFAKTDIIVFGVEPDGSLPKTAPKLFDSPLWSNVPAVKAGNVVRLEHYAAATHSTAILALQSIDEELAKLPAFKSGN